MYITLFACGCANWRKSVEFSARTPSICRCLAVALGIWLQSCDAVGAQAEDRNEPLHLSNVGLSGVRTSLSDRWANLEMTIAKSSLVARDVRVVVFFTSQPDDQYARDVWLPGRSSLATWMLLGPEPN